MIMQNTAQQVDHDLYHSPSIVRDMKPRRMMSSKYVPQTRKCEMHMKCWSKYLKRSEQLGRPKRRW
jgi:hypothetical protein